MTRRSAVLVIAVALLGGCAQDAVCRSGEYPVQQVGGTGRQCVPRKQEPPAGWARYPAGQEPEHVDDKWDVFWRTHSLDRDGAVVEVG